MMHAKHLEFKQISQDLHVINQDRQQSDSFKTELIKCFLIHFNNYYCNWNNMPINEHNYCDITTTCLNYPWKNKTYPIITDVSIDHYNLGLFKNIHTTKDS